MAKKKGEARFTLGLTCTICKRRNYVSQRNKLNTTEKLKLTKYCKYCQKKTEHKEVEKLK
jgi:large subunit ribosomal protein L33